MIKCLTNQKVYIGSAVNIARRWKRHRSDLKCNRHDSQHLQNAYNKYGVDNFEFTVIEYVSKENLIIREQYHIDILSKEILFNMCPFAQSCLGRKSSSETRAKISAAGRNRKHSAETRAKLSITNSGWKHSTETKLKMSILASANNKKRSPEVIARIASANRGKRHTAEARAKISVSSRGRKHTIEARAKISATSRGRPSYNKGKPMPEEQKIKQRIGYQERRQSLPIPQYQDNNWLYEHYIVQQLSTLKIADIAKCSSATIQSWLVRYNIPRRPSTMF